MVVVPRSIAWCACILWLYWVPLAAQTPRIDSLRLKIESKHQYDTTRFILLVQLLWELRIIDPVQAIMYGREALSIAHAQTRLFSSARWQYRLAELHRFLGVAYRNIGEYEKASKSVYTALELDQQRGDSIEIGHSLNTLARILLLQNNIAKAADYAHQALAIAERFHDDKLQAFALFTLADVYYQRKEFSAALATAQRVVALRRKRGEEIYVADTYLAIARNLTYLKRFDEAYAYIQQALDIYRAQRIPYNQAVGYNAMARFLIVSKRASEAVYYAHTALTIADSLQAKALQQEALELLAAAHEEQGNYQVALRMYRRSDSLADMLLSERIAKQQAILDIEYETKLREQKIQTFEQERRTNISIAIGISIVVLIIIAAITVRMQQREKRQEHERAELLQRAEELIDVNHALRLAQIELHDNQERMARLLRELQARNDELSEMNQEKTMILGMVSHDLKNPISSIQIAAEMIATESTSLQESQQLAQMILETTTKMLSLVKNFLDVARAEQGRLNIRYNEFDITSVIEATLQQYAPHAERKQITIHYSKPDFTATVYADESLTAQVFDNLLSNALKYTPPGKHVFIDIHTSQVLHHNIALLNRDLDTLDTSDFIDCIRVSVTDEGPGLTDDDKTKLFTKFARLSAQPTGGESSTGLGLAIAKRLVESMNGRIWCESEYGFGARFTFELPRYAA
ncbi:MAG: ATP-binding protein [Bacteroidota bacterium]|nr:ATP-binding protein [Candidatus Kapabacteria bacterium]MDW8220769.1 ATP-binding protein [Bacteroidota bacterium]